MIATAITLFFMGMTVASRQVFGFSFRQSLVFAPMAFFSCLFATGGPLEIPEQDTQNKHIHLTVPSDVQVDANLYRNGEHIHTESF
jgi:hypothetical protein